MASPSYDHQTQSRLQASLPQRRVRLHYDTHIPLRSNRFHGLLQRPRTQLEGATPQLVSRGRRENQQILQPGHPSSSFRTTDIRSQGFEIDTPKSPYWNASPVPQIESVHEIDIPSFIIQEACFQRSYNSTCAEEQDRKK